MSENKHEHGYVGDILKITVKTVRTQKSRFEFLSECREFHFHLLLWKLTFFSAIQIYHLGSLIFSQYFSITKCVYKIESI